MTAPSGPVVPEPVNPAALRALIEDPELLEIGRKAVEDDLIEWRDSRRFTLRSNGFTIRERDGSNSTIIRYGPEWGLRVMLRAIAEHLEASQ